MTPIIDRAGQTFGQLTVLSINGRVGRRIFWNAKCACGTIAVVRMDALTRGHTVSCGCISKLRLAEHRNKHGQVGSRAYASWISMRSRTTRNTCSNFPTYGGAGITCCDEWSDFAQFFADMGPAPPGCSIDRIDNSLGYFPGNCRWATKKQQARNTRSNSNIEWRGRTQCIAGWAEELNINGATLRARLRYGWSIDRAFTAPIVGRGHYLQASA